MAGPGCSSYLQLDSSTAAQPALTLIDSADEVCCNGDRERMSEDNEWTTEIVRASVKTSVQSRNLDWDDLDTENVSHVPR